MIARSEPPARVAPSEPPPSLPPCRVVNKRAGRYSLKGEIGDGGMATVYVGHQEGGGFRRPVAVKVLHEHLARDANYTRRFLDEMRLVSMIHHPFVSRVFDHGETKDGRPYFVMEYLLGEPLWRVLRAMLRRRKSLDPVQRVNFVVRVIADLAEGLHAAHEARDDQGEALNVIHRDISPQNLFVMYDGTVRLVDFGVARHEAADVHTRTGAIMGKLAYMAPEQIHGEDYDRRLDIWALGVVLWELLACKRLFRRSAEMATLRAVCYDPIPSLVALGVADAELEAVVNRALERMVHQRTRTARELATSLYRWLSKRGNMMVTADISEQMQLLFPGSRLERERWARSSPELEADHLLVERTTGPSLEWQSLLAEEAEMWREARTATEPVDTSNLDASQTGEVESSDLMESTTGLFLKVDVDLQGMECSSTEPSVYARPESVDTGRVAAPASIQAAREAVSAELERALGESRSLALDTRQLRRRRVGALAALLGVACVVVAAKGMWIPRDGSSKGHEVLAQPVSRPVASPVVQKSLPEFEPTEDTPGEPPAAAVIDEPDEASPGPSAVHGRALAPAKPARLVRRVSESAKRPTPEPTREEAVEFGYAYVTTSGGKARVLEGGRVLGTTPLRIRLASGSYALELTPLGGGPGSVVSATIRPGGTTLVTAHIAVDRGTGAQQTELAATGAR